MAISIHTLVKRATPTLTQRVHIGAISIHALVKRATKCLNIGHKVVFISIHALVKGATTYHKFVAIVIGNFNPRPRKEGDAVMIQNIL